MSLMAVLKTHLKNYLNDLPDAECPILSLNLLTYAKQTSQQQKKRIKKLKMSLALTKLLDYRSVGGGGGVDKDNITDKRGETMTQTKSVAFTYFTHIHRSRGCRTLKDKGNTVVFLSVMERSAAGGFFLGGGIVGLSRSSAEQTDLSGKNVPFVLVC